VELALLVILLMCSDHERLLVIVTPRYLASLVCWITESQIEYFDDKRCVLELIVNAYIYKD